jgi:hypothetical protein
VGRNERHGDRATDGPVAPKNIWWQILQAAVKSAASGLGGKFRTAQESKFYQPPYQI